MESPEDKKTLPGETQSAVGEGGAVDSLGVSAHTSSPGIPFVSRVQTCHRPQIQELHRGPAEILGANVEIDCLEQFGISSFKKSAFKKKIIGFSLLL